MKRIPMLALALLIALVAASVAVADDRLKAVADKRSAEALLPHLLAADVVEVRLAVQTLGELDDATSRAWLDKLWAGSPLPDAPNGGGPLLGDPRVRLMVAQQLVRRDPERKRQYADYIKAQARSSRTAVQNAAAEALGPVGDKEAVALLTDFVRGSEVQSAQIAAQALALIAREGPETELARATIAKLAKDDAVRFRSVKAVLEASQAAGREVAGGERDVVQQVTTDYFMLGRFEEGVALLRPLAEQGDSRAQNMLGDALLNGPAVVKDPAEGVRWLHKAADQGEVSAMYSLGMAYLFGNGAAKDRERGVDFLQQAAAKGHEQAQRLLAALAK